MTNYKVGEGVMVYTSIPETIEDPIRQSLTDTKTLFRKYVELVWSDTLPEDFSDWHIADEHGWSLAHEYVSIKKLPANFTNWSLADKNGTTVAHQAALAGRLPDGFSQWDLTDNDGWTVARMAVYAGYTRRFQ